MSLLQKELSVLTMAGKFRELRRDEQQSKGDALSLDDLQKAIDKMWHLQKGGEEVLNGDGGANNSELGLGLVSFHGTCFNCGEKGHRKNKCPKLKGEQKNWKFNGTRSASCVGRP